MLFKDCERTDGQTDDDDDDDDDGQWVITIAHLELSAQGELKMLFHIPFRMGPTLKPIAVNFR